MSTTFIDPTNVIPTVILPSPEFDDEFSVKYVKYIKMSRGKELITGKKSGYDNRSKINKLKYTFKFLSFQQRYNLLEFMYYTVGKIVTIIDYNGSEYQVVITTPSNEISNESRNNNSLVIEAEIINIISVDPTGDS